MNRPGQTCLVLVETDGAEVGEVSREALTFARECGWSPSAVLVGAPDDAVIEQLGGYGVPRALVLTGDGFASYAAAAWAAGLQQVLATVADVGVVLAAGTQRGNEVMAHLACRSGAAMAANVVSLTSEADGLRVQRQVLGGAALEELVLRDGPAVLSLAGHACDPTPAETATSPSVETVAVDVAAEDLRAAVVRTEPGEPDESGQLKSAPVVVGAGRGAGGPDGFGDLLELAELLDAPLGVSRVVTSLGWRPHHEQVGQTGSRISPELYIPCGISGAIQHWAGCSSARTILAINSDEDAPMVAKAHYAVIGDLHEIVPAINEELRRRR